LLIPFPWTECIPKSDSVAYFFWFEFQELLFLQDPSYLLVRKLPSTKNPPLKTTFTTKQDLLIQTETTKHLRRTDTETYWETTCRTRNPPSSKCDVPTRTSQSGRHAPPSPIMRRWEDVSSWNDSGPSHESNESRETKWFARVKRSTYGENDTVVS
jgi:hypothetical protein